jgi:hypothetical protein
MLFSRLLYDLNDVTVMKLAFNFSFYKVLNDDFYCHIILVLRQPYNSILNKITYSSGILMGRDFF